MGITLLTEEQLINAPGGGGGGGGATVAYVDAQIDLAKDYTDDEIADIVLYVNAEVKLVRDDLEDHMEEPHGGGAGVQEWMQVNKDNTSQLINNSASETITGWENPWGTWNTDALKPTMDTTGGIITLHKLGQYVFCVYGCAKILNVVDTAHNTNIFLWWRPTGGGAWSYIPNATDHQYNVRGDIYGCGSVQFNEFHLLFNPPVDSEFMVTDSGVGGEAELQPSLPRINIKRIGDFEAAQYA